MRLRPPKEWRHLIEVETGCWLWTGPTRNGLPVLPRADRQKDSGHRRARSEMLRLCGYEDPGTRATTLSCGHDLCVNPKHIVIRELPKREVEPRTFRSDVWTLDDLRGFKRAHDAGYSWAAIGAEKGISRERVRQLVERYEAHLLAEGSAGPA